MVPSPNRLMTFLLCPVLCCFLLPFAPLCYSSAPPTPLRSCVVEIGIKYSKNQLVCLELFKLRLICPNVIWNEFSKVVAKFRFHVILSVQNGKEPSGFYPDGLKIWLWLNLDWSPTLCTLCMHSASLCVFCVLCAWGWLATSLEASVTAHFFHFDCIHSHWRI